MRQLKENSGVKKEILLTTAINRYEGVRLAAPGTVEEVDVFIQTYRRATGLVQECGVDLGDPRMVLHKFKQKIEIGRAHV